MWADGVSFPHLSLNLGEEFQPFLESIEDGTLTSICPCL